MPKEIVVVGNTPFFATTWHVLDWGSEKPILNEYDMRDRQGNAISVICTWHSTYEWASFVAETRKEVNNATVIR